MLTEAQLQRIDDIAAEFELGRLKRELDPSADISNFRKLTTKMVKTWRLSSLLQAKAMLSCEERDSVHATSNG